MYSTRILSITLAFFCNLHRAENAKILAITPEDSYSHFKMGFKLMKELANRGHDVTMVSPFSQDTPIKNYRDVSIKSQNRTDEYVRELFETTGRSPYSSTNSLCELGHKIADLTYSSPNFQQLLHSNETFDLVITEEFYIPSLLGVAYHFDAPNILLTYARISNANNYYFANSDEPAYVPMSLSPFIGHMDFWQRFRNFLYILHVHIKRHFVFLPKQNEILHKYLPNAPQIEDLIYNQSLILLNSHFSFVDPSPHLPNMIDIAGLHIDPPKPLPKDLTDFLDGAKEGVIYFSMGTILKSTFMHPHKLNAILNGFKRLKQKVLFKFEGESLPNKPHNVKIAKWVPQSDVLAHPNVRIYVSHGGIGGMIEAMYHGIPVVGIPILGDQPANIARAVDQGAALKVDYKKLTEESFFAAVSEVLNNPK